MKFGLSQPMRQANADFENLEQANKLEKKNVTFLRLSDNDMKLVVEFIRSPENFVTWSYGVKDVIISNNETICLLRIQRIKSIKKIINKYIEHVRWNINV